MQRSKRSAPGEIKKKKKDEEEREREERKNIYYLIIVVKNDSDSLQLCYANSRGEIGLRFPDPAGY